MKNRKLKTLLAIRSSNESFHASFPDADETEEVVAAFNCAYSKDILHQGKLYVTPSRFYFHSNIFGFEENIIIDCNKITSITREKTALFFPTAILIRCGETKYMFASFMSREQVYRLMFRVWQSVLLGTPLTAEELSQSKKFQYRRLEREVTQVNGNDDQDIELTRSKSTDDPAIFVDSSPTHTEIRHRRTKSDGSSISSSRSLDDHFNMNTSLSRPQIHVSTTALSDGEQTVELARSLQHEAHSPSPDGLRVSFDIQQSSNADSTSGLIHSSDGEAGSNTDLSTDLDDLTPSVESWQKQDTTKRKTKKKGILAKFFHFQHARNKENMTHKRSHPYVDYTLKSALVSASLAAPCALAENIRLSVPFALPLKAGEYNKLRTEAKPQEDMTHNTADVVQGQPVSEINFQARLKRVPLQIRSKASGAVELLLTKLQSLSFTSLLVIVTVLFIAMVWCSTAILACRMSSFDPVVASFYPLTYVCSSHELHKRRLSNGAIGEEATVDKLNARLKAFDQVRSDSFLATNPTPVAGLSSSKSPPH